ncbi:hypothetical protein CEXT_302431 [Caerostris extrusa]|uniref:Secreted protein n=1 Tax=Caerostris extrusa TaxID=172846 RepID=A0AAV4XRC6_CAEEX|nr:hypothetical protein CEXT_302431 [Caerostris extrusa]
MLLLYSLHFFSKQLCTLLTRIECSSFFFLLSIKCTVPFIFRDKKKGKTGAARSGTCCAGVVKVKLERCKVAGSPGIPDDGFGAGRIDLSPTFSQVRPPAPKLCHSLFVWAGSTIDASCERCGLHTVKLCSVQVFKSNYSLMHLIDSFFITRYD